MKKFKQMNLIQRTQLSVLLKQKDSLKEIANEMGVSRQTLYRELMRNSYSKSNDLIGRNTSCIHFEECRKLVSVKSIVCHPNCIKYEPQKRDCLKKYPFVCNYCNKKGKCTSLQIFYDPEHASNEYHLRIKEANAVPKTDKETIKKINKLVSPLVKKGQSIEAILMNHPEVNVSPLTIRKWIRNGYLDCRLSELRMAGRRVSKQYDYSNVKEHKKLSEAKFGHKYIEYCLYKKMNPDTITIQLDSVIGTIDGKHYILTIIIVEFKFQFGLLLDTKKPQDVVDRLNMLVNNLKQLQEDTGIAAYDAFTQCWLTDNGCEFDKILDLLNYHNMNIFFCNPNASFQKGACEKNHVMVRYIHYKGWSFDNLNQNDINILFSNINSYPRRSLNKKTPYQSVLDEPRLGKEFLDLIGINKIDGDDVILNPSLLRKIKK